MLARFYDDTIVDDSNNVRVDDGRESVSDKDRGSALSSIVKGFLDDLKRFNNYFFINRNLPFHFQYRAH